MNTRRSKRAIVVAIFWSAASQGLAQAPDAGAAAPKTAAVQAAERDLWAPGQARYIRHWQVRASSEPLADEAGLAPGASGQPAWASHTAWSDVNELNGPAGGRGEPEAPRYAYAHTVVRRAEAGPAEVAIGATGPVMVWLNGVLVGQAPGATAMARDRVRWPVQLKAGDNRLLIRSENRGGPWLLTARVLNRNQPLPESERLMPTLSMEADKLQVRTDVVARSTPVAVTVLAPGGRVVAEAQAPRGATARFDTASWTTGPYEVRLRGADAFGRAVTTFLPWYKGDPRPAALALRARAATATATTARDGHWRMLRDLLNERAGADLARLDAGDPGVHAALTEAAELDLDGPGSLQGSGFARLAWVDPVDGSTQFCRAYLPPGYDGSTALPTVLYLHGFNPANPPYVGFWGVDERHNDVAERHGVIFIAAHGRANAQYIGIGERDVLNCLESARARLKVDDERTYLTGDSMGGSGTWLVGSRHADRFAAIAPVFGGWDFRLQPGQGLDNPAADRPMERWTAEAHSSFAGAEQLNNTPVFVMHGDDDQTVDVRFSRHIVQRLQRWGYDVRYREYPGLGHEDLGQIDDTVAWLLKHRRTSAPRQVRVRAIDLSGAKAWWLRVDGAQRPLELIEADAEAVEPGLLRLDTRNVARVTLSPPAALLQSGAPLKVVWNGEVREVALDGQGQATLAESGAPRGPLLKKAGLEGGLSDAFATPFVIVVGTSSRDPEMRRLIRAKAERLAGTWRAWQHVPPRLVDDSALTPEMERGLTLVLIGGADDNRVTQRLGGRVPLKVEKAAVTIDGRRFAVRDAVTQMIRPSPWATDRYVMVVAAASPEGMYRWNAGGYWQFPAGRPANSYDWTISDGRMPAIAPGLSPERGWVASGVFDASWRLEERLTFLGDPALRAAAPLRRMVRNPVAVPAAALDRYAGRYELFPGVTFELRREGADLVATPPSGPPLKLLAEGVTVFAVDEPPARLEVRLGPDGRPVDLLVTTEEGQTVWRRR